MLISKITVIITYSRIISVLQDWYGDREYTNSLTSAWEKTKKLISFETYCCSSLSMNTGSTTPKTRWLMVWFSKTKYLDCNSGGIEPASFRSYQMNSTFFWNTRALQSCDLTSMFVVSCILRLINHSWKASSLDDESVICVVKAQLNCAPYCTNRSWFALYLHT